MSTPQRAARDINRVETLLAISSDGSGATVQVEADPLTGRLLVNSTGGAGGTQYTDGQAAAANPVGTQPVYTNGSGITTAVSTSNPLPVSASVAPTPDASPATQNITAQDTGSTTTTLANNQSVRTGSPTANSTATFALSSWETVSIEVTGTWTGTLLVEGSFDNGTRYYQKAVKQIGTSYIANNFTANFAGTVNVATLNQLVVRSTATWTGTATVTIRESTNNNGIYVHNGLNIQDSVIATNKLTVKSASTAAVATDPAVVVAISPNNIVTSVNSELPDTTGTITNATQTTPIVATGLAGYDNVLVTISGTYGTATATFQGSDDGGTTWYNTTVATRTDSPVIEGGYTSLTNITRAWNINIQGFDSFRVNPSAVASGTVNIRISPESAPTNAGATVQLGAQLPSGTNVIGHVIADSGSTTAVTQPTAASLNATIVGTGTFAVQAAATLAAETTKVIGVTRTADGSGNLLTSTTNALDVNIKSGNLTTLPVTNTGTFAVQATQSGTWNIGASTATGSAVPANALYQGGIAKTANPSAASDGNLTGVLLDKLGKVISVGSIRDLKVNQVTTITASVSETTVLTQVASTFLDVYGVIVTNTSATAVTVAFKDSTTGTTQFNIAVPAGDTRGFMLPEGGAIKQGTVNNNWTATTQSVTSVIITMLAVKNI